MSYIITVLTRPRKPIARRSRTKRSHKFANKLLEKLPKDIPRYFDWRGQNVIGDVHNQGIDN